MVSSSGAAASTAESKSSSAAAFFLLGRPRLRFPVLGAVAVIAEDARAGGEGDGESAFAEDDDEEEEEEAAAEEEPPRGFRERRPRPRLDGSEDAAAALAPSLNLGDCALLSVICVSPLLSGCCCC